MTLLRTAALSDIGRVRRKNEDRMLHDAALQLYGVADGVGGLPGGAEAAELAVDEIAAAFRKRRAQDKDLTAIVHRVNRSVYALSEKLSPVLGLGCTLTFGWIHETVLHLAHVGDSRCYAWRKSEFMPLTNDHSVENEARMRRARGEVVCYHESDRNALTRCIGQPTPPLVDIVDRPLRAGDRYLFCTDGVTRLVRDSELQEALGGPLEPEDMLRGIIALAVRRGGPDNATGVVVFVDEI